MSLFFDNVCQLLESGVSSPPIPPIGAVAVFDAMNHPISFNVEGVISKIMINELIHDLKLPKGQICNSFNFI